MIDTLRALTVAAHGLEELERRYCQIRARAQGCGLAGPAHRYAAFVSLSYEADQQSAIWEALLASGMPTQREVKFLSWGYRMSASVDFLLLDNAVTPTTAGCIPVQYKPPRATTTEVVADLLSLGLWWPGSRPRSLRRLAWIASLEHEALVNDVSAAFEQKVAAARAAGSTSSDGRSSAIALWNPSLRHNATVEVLTSSPTERIWLHEFEVHGWTGTTPAEQASPPDYLEFDNKHLEVPFRT
jgi:hypothetical protein